jgi:hypothetical protein
MEHKFCTLTFQTLPCLTKLILAYIITVHESPMIYTIDTTDTTNATYKEKSFNIHIPQNTKFGV